VWSTLD